MIILLLSANYVILLLKIKVIIVIIVMFVFKNMIIIVFGLVNVLVKIIIKYFIYL